MEITLFFWFFLEHADATSRSFHAAKTVVTFDYEQRVFRTFWI